jgi:hypothetical protein
MAISAPSPRISRGSVDAALTLTKNPIARSDDSRLAAGIAPVAGDSTTNRGGHREAPEAAPHAEPIDAKWQSAIDAATD